MKKREKICLFTAALCVAGCLLRFFLASSGVPVVRHELGAPQGEKLCINTADAEALELLPGIGPVLAEALLERRDELGGFRSREELLSVDGFGEARLAAIEAYITY